MLTRIYIDNFRSFVNFEYQPGRRALLLGSNGSGKTSLLDAIRYLKRFVKGDPNRFTQSTRTRWQDQLTQVIEMEAALDGKSFDYRVEVAFAGPTREPVIQLERLKVSGATAFELSAGRVRFYGDDRSSYTVPLQTSRSVLHLSVLGNPDVRRFVEWLNHVHCFGIDAYPGTMNEAADSEEFEPDFEMDNLAGWYRHLVQSYPEENIRFLASLEECMDGFQTLKFSSSDEDGVRKLRTEFTAPGGRRVSYSLSELSEGQRCLIALYMILHFLISRGDTVFVDEPDNFIALREIQPWLLAADQAVDDHRSQLVLISHHPEILNQWAADYGVRFFREQNGHVRTEKFRPDEAGNLQPSDLIARGWE